MTASLEPLSPFGIDSFVGPEGLDVMGATEVAASTSPPLTFPSSPLGVKLYVAPTADPNADPDLWTWTEIAANHILWRDKVVITRGRTPGQTQANPSTMNLSLKDAQGRHTWGLGTPMRFDVNPGTGAVRRMTSFVTARPPRSDTSGNSRWLALQTAGVLQRLGRGNSAAHSASYGAVRLVTHLIDTGIPGTLAFWWPLEDAAGSTSAATPLVDGSPAASGSAQFASASVPAGIAAAPTMIGKTITGTAIPLSDEGGYAVAFYAQASDVCTPILWSTTSPTAAQVSVRLAANSARVYVNGIATAADATTVNPIDGEWHYIVVSIDEHNVPGSIAISIFVDADATGLDTIAATTAGVLQSVVMNYGGAASLTAMAQVAGGPVTFSISGTIINGYPGERAMDRALRIARIEAIPFEVGGGVADFSNQYVGDADANGNREFSETMGPQTVQTALSIFREAEAAEDGFLVEGLSGRLRLDAHDTRENLPVALTLHVGAGGNAQVLPPFEPGRDDQRIVNDVAVGLSRDTEEFGGLGIAQVGRYDTSASSISVSTATSAANHASFEAMRGTRDEPRFDAVSFDLSKSPELIAAWVSRDPIGMHVVIENIDETIWLQDSHQHVIGYTETIDQSTWLVTAYLTPEAPYRTWTLGSAEENLGRLDNPGSTLVGDLSDDYTITSIQVASPGALWRTGPAGWPLQLSGEPCERVEVVSIAGASSPQTFTITRTQGKTVPHLNGCSTTLWRPGVIALLDRGTII